MFGSRLLREANRKFLLGANGGATMLGWAHLWGGGETTRKFFVFFSSSFCGGGGRRCCGILFGGHGQTRETVVFGEGGHHAGGWSPFWGVGRVWAIHGCLFVWLELQVCHGGLPRVVTVSLYFPRSAQIQAWGRFLGRSLLGFSRNPKGN